MFRRMLVPLIFAVGAGACAADHAVSTAGAPGAAVGVARNARERLARRLAMALADPALRAAIKHRLDVSNAPEGKLQFQALAHAEQGVLLVSMARADAASTGELLADLDAARGLELYLPVRAQRDAWRGDDNYLVGTIGSDGELPVAFDSRGAGHALDPNAPPPTPVLALVPQETDFTGGRPSRMMSCVDMCGDAGGGAGGSGNSTTSAGSAPGLYLVQSHFGDTYESWLKGNPEFEYHVYGIGDNGESIELACTGEHSGGVYSWDQNDRDWAGAAMLLSDVDYKAYQAKHPGAPIRIVAWEDDDEPCVDHVDVSGVSALITAVDNAYKAVTSGKVDPWYVRGIRSATSLFSLVTALHNVILTNDDFIGNAVEGTVSGDAPNGSNWVLKTNGTVTTGWFTTARVGAPN